MEPTPEGPAPSRLYKETVGFSPTPSRLYGETVKLGLTGSELPVTVAELPVTVVEPILALAKLPPTVVKLAIVVVELQSPLDGERGQLQDDRRHVRDDPQVLGGRSWEFRCGEASVELHAP